jgi:hypothetical protein
LSATLYLSIHLSGSFSSFPISLGSSLSEFVYPLSLFSFLSLSVSLYLCIFPFLCRSVVGQSPSRYLSLCLSATFFCFSLRLFFFRSLFLCLPLSAGLFLFCLSVLFCLFVYLFVCLSTFLSVCLRYCLYYCLSNCFYFSAFLFISVICIFPLYLYHLSFSCSISN